VSKSRGKDGTKTWEDTVMSDEQLQAIDITKFYNEKSFILNFIKYQRATAQAQAEETWDIAFEAGKQEGRREVTKHFIDRIQTLANTNWADEDQRQQILKELKERGIEK